MKLISLLKRSASPSNTARKLKKAITKPATAKSSGGSILTKNTKEQKLQRGHAPKTMNDPAFTQYTKNEPGGSPAHLPKFVGTKPSGAPKKVSGGSINVMGKPMKQVGNVKNSSKNMMPNSAQGLKVSAKKNLVAKTSSKMDKEDKKDGGRDEASENKKKSRRMSDIKKQTRAIQASMKKNAPYNI